MALSTKLLPRSVLAEFLPNPRAIRAFEDIQQDIIDGADFTGSVAGASIITLGPATALEGARTLTAGPGVQLTDGGAGNNLTLGVVLNATSPLGYDAGTATVSLASPVPIALGGTGQTTAPAAINALLPAQAGQTGKFLTTDGTAASWATPGGGGGGGAFGEFAYRPPLAADFPVSVTSTSATITMTDVAGKGLVVQNTRGSLGGGGAVLRTPPSLPFTIPLRFTAQALIIPTTSTRCGLILRNSTNGRCLILYRSDADLLLQGWNNIDSFNSNISQLTISSNKVYAGAMYLALSVSAAGLVTPYYSNDGAIWQSFGTTTLSTYLTAAGGSLDQIGYWSNPNSGSGGAVNSLLAFWRVDAIDPPAVALS